MLIQIYGLTTAEDAALVNGLGVDHAGVVLDEGLDTWDSVAAATARAIVHELESVTVVALSLSTARDRILRTIDITQPAIVHLARACVHASGATRSGGAHGGGMSPSELDILRTEIAPVQLMVTIPVVDATAVAVARDYAAAADFLLLDSAHPRTGVVGATGLVHDLSLSAQVVASVEGPVFLAGGLGPDNVVAAMARVRPAGVDSESRTSRDDDRRRKDGRKVRDFVARVRAA